MSAARAWILFAGVSAAAGAAAAALSGYEVPRALLAAGVLFLWVAAGSAIARARRGGDEMVLPACSELSTLAFPPSTPAERGRCG